MSSNNKQPSANQAMTTAAQTAVARQPAPAPQMGTRSNTGNCTDEYVKVCAGVCEIGLCCPFHSFAGSGIGNDCGRTCGGCDCNDCSGDC
ncbi:hypothetical protein BOTCAL_0249g00050 [Botryotinia calthae]|uniref:Uncharacterized protein n=1 Tax=Botryotinia calthae TaxID=38488 RepID=A0A4Y8CXG4_9HELO|nr:hypothetical protein BOTCAL_0249g00050 [Botryotinia calthae]